MKSLSTCELVLLLSLSLSFNVLANNLKIPNNKDCPSVVLISNLIHTMPMNSDFYVQQANQLQDGLGVNIKYLSKEFYLLRPNTFSSLISNLCHGYSIPSNISISDLIECNEVKELDQLKKCTINILNK